jgi:L-alanine-DL-glutamate epimerase-like enolase superfamily enzyme
VKIAQLRLIEVSGTLEFAEPFWEERLIRPIDVYPEFQVEGPPERPRRLTSIFVELESDSGVVGRAGPIPVEQAFLIDTQLRPIVEGADPLANEVLWDKLYRFAVHGRKGVEMQAISAIDCAVWDLKGRWANAPVHRLLGGPSRAEIPAYASALGYSVEPERAAERARELVSQGYRATKWFFRAGPADGPAGIQRNLALVRALREAIGPDVDLMLDCWMSWDVPYTLRMAHLLAEYRPRWIEEPVQPDRIDSYARLRLASPVPIAGGEHEYTRWGLKQLMDAQAVDVLQPDIYWAGGITEMQKICALASCYDLPVIPHGHSTPASAHLIASQPTNLCPLLEYLVKWNEINQFFLRQPLKPVGGVIQVPETPGLGMDLDESRIEQRRVLRWGD